MNISVVIPTLNEEDYIQQTLLALQNQTHKPNEVIVVDACSTDKTQKRALQCFKNQKTIDIKVITAKKGVWHQRNIGWRHAKGDIVIFVDADTLLHKTFVQTVFETFQNNNITIGIPKYTYPKNTHSSIKISQELLNSIIRATLWITPFGQGPCLVFKKQNMTEQVIFKNIIPGEDTEAVRRLSKKYQITSIQNKVILSDCRFKAKGIIKELFIYTYTAPLIIFE